MGSLRLLRRWLQGNSLAIGHVGDSRIYLVRRGAIQQLTQDHSLVMEQVRRRLHHAGAGAEVRDAEHHPAGPGVGRNC